MYLIIFNDLTMCQCEDIDTDVQKGVNDGLCKVVKYRDSSYYEVDDGDYTLIQET